RRGNFLQRPECRTPCFRVIHWASPRARRDGPTHPPLCRFQVDSVGADDPKDGRDLQLQAGVLLLRYGLALALLLRLRDQPPASEATPLPPTRGAFWELDCPRQE